MSKVTVYQVEWMKEAYQLREVAAYEGDFVAGLNPANALIISEMMPDVGNVNDGQPHQAIRAIYNSGDWSKVDIND